MMRMPTTTVLRHTELNVGGSKDSASAPAPPKYSKGHGKQKPSQFDDNSNKKRYVWIFVLAVTRNDNIDHAKVVAARVDLLHINLDTFIESLNCQLKYARDGPRNEEPYAYLSPAIPGPRPFPLGKYPRPGMVGENSFAHLQGCPREETRPLICVGAMTLRIRLISSHPRPRWGMLGEREDKNSAPPPSVKFSLMATPRTNVDPPFRKRLPRAAKRAQVKVFVEETLKKGVRGLVAEFKSMKRLNDFTKMTEFLAQTPQGRNRYKDVGCLDNDRVILRIGPVSYIHANYVSTPMSPKRFICTQAPLPKTCPEFWYMVVQEKSTAVLMLCNFVEQKAKKCAEYFPTQEGAPLVFEGNVSVQLKKQEPFPFPFETKVKIMVRQLEVSVPDQPVHTCTHYHWMDWPDRGVPEADLAPIALLSRLKECTTPIIVHCSAGIGRTGSIVLIEHAMELLHQPAPLLEISGYLTELRKQRNNSIQTEHQYLYIHQVILVYLKKTKFLDDSVTPYLEAFTKEYVAATKGF
ncbi:hypothetical protein Y032_0060g3186 [Ancylostoma ceylanicum]|uniref:Protein-tyrosine phosphatase n=1 Tax=Ancylostoma ceylanicum TaxID=53326 RepID=A0A016U387_9BILA|nr:hypothetical protein Y032_0060g3186 [Ancylostoma ceylanicum]